MENPIKMDDLGVPPFKETPIWPQVMYFWKSGVFAMTHFGLTTPKMFPRSLGSSTLCFQGVWGGGGSTFWSWDIAFERFISCYFQIILVSWLFVLPDVWEYSFAWFEKEWVEIPVCIQDVLFTWDTAILPWRFKRWCSIESQHQRRQQLHDTSNAAPMFFSKKQQITSFLLHAF